MTVLFKAYLLQADDSLFNFMHYLEYSQQLFYNKSWCLFPTQATQQQLTSPRLPGWRPDGGTSGRQQNHPGSIITSRLPQMFLASTYPPEDRCGTLCAHTCMWRSTSDCRPVWWSWLNWPRPGLGNFDDEEGHYSFTLTPEGLTAYTVKHSK